MEWAGPGAGPGAVRWAGPSAGAGPQPGEVVREAGPAAVGNEGVGLVVGWPVEAGPEVKRAE